MPNDFRKYLGAFQGYKTGAKPPEMKQGELEKEERGGLES